MRLNLSDAVDDIAPLAPPPCFHNRESWLQYLKSAQLCKTAVRLAWDKQAKQWLLTAFKKKAGGGTRTDTAASSAGGDTARPDAGKTNVAQMVPGSLRPLWRSTRGAGRQPHRVSPLRSLETPSRG